MTLLLSNGIVIAKLYYLPIEQCGVMAERINALIMYYRLLGMAYWDVWAFL